MSLHIIKHHLPISEYFQSSTPKDTIYLHHTFGGHIPSSVINWWNLDMTNRSNRIRTATSYVIGSKSTRDGSTEFDGKIYEAFDPSFWAHHLGIKSNKNTFLNQKSIGIEICNYGNLTLSKNGKFYTYAKSEVPESDVVELSNPFRGNIYYHRYTDAQLESLYSLLKKLSADFDIDLSRGLKHEINKSTLSIPETISGKGLQRWLNKNGFRDSRGMKLVDDGIVGAKTKEAMSKVGLCPFEMNADALGGSPGIWSHSNVRKDKNSVSPQPQLLELILSL